jgi:GTP-binding protein
VIGSDAHAKVRPPTFVLFCTRADTVPDAYRRDLVNALRDAFDLSGTDNCHRNS